MFKKWFEEDIELTVGQLILLVGGCAIAVVLGALWLNGDLYEFGHVATHGVFLKH